MLARRTVYVKARSREVVPPEDGYSWRKYGQKLILGAKYPREYYRCAHRRLSLCAATKMVQQSETEPLEFEVTYGGSHSCGQEKKNLHGEHVLTKKTQCDEVGKAAGETSECYTPEMVSTPNNSFNNFSTGIVSSNSNSGFFSTQTSSPFPNVNIPLYDDNATGLIDDESYNAMFMNSPADAEWRNPFFDRQLSSCAATKTVQQSETEPLTFEVTYGGSRSCGQEKKHQLGEHVLTKETQCDEVGRAVGETFQFFTREMVEKFGRAAGETSQFFTPDMVSTPNNSFNNSSTGDMSSNSNSGFFSTPISSPYPDMNDDNATGLIDDESYSAMLMNPLACDEDELQDELSLKSLLD